MRRRLPPLNALRAFEAGAHYLSFTRAAEDLSVTQTAISHQVRALEDWLGRRLFRRAGRRLALTPAGRAMLPVVAEALDGIAAVTERVRSEPGRTTLTLSVTPTFGARWLAERLGRFWREHPDVDLRLHHSVHLVDLAREEVDAAVRWGRGDWPGLHTVRLMRASAAPMCSPALAAADPPIRVPGDLRHHVLLHEKDYQEWTEWLAARGVRGVDGQRGPLMDSSAALLRAAVGGDGVLMGVPALLADEIAAGRLVVLFEADPDPALAYYFACLPSALERREVSAFRDFLLAEVPDKA